MDLSHDSARNRNKSQLRRATDTDWKVFTTKPVPDVWFGLVAESHMLLGIGGAYWGTDGRWWAVFARAPGVRGMAITAHRAALIVIDIADGMEINLHAMPDTSIAKSGFWLRRLGFEETTEHIEGHEVWVRNWQSSAQLSARPAQHLERSHNPTL